MTVRSKLMRAIWIAASIVTLGLWLLVHSLMPIAHHLPTTIADDGDYYLIVARNIARTGISTFDGFTLTNGYQPLYTWLLALVFLVFRATPLLMVLLGGVLGTLSFALLIARSPIRTPLGIALSMMIFIKLAAAFSLSGMETGLEFACASLLIFTICGASEDVKLPFGILLPRGVSVGVALTLAVLSRIDAAVFLLPVVFFSPLQRKTRATALIIAAIAGAIYLTYNLSFFGTMLPISGAVKSLGGIQLNRPFLIQLRWEIIEYGVRSPEVQMLLMFLAGPFLIWGSTPSTIARTLSLALFIGGCLYVSRLVFASSWELWTWYDYPIFFGVAAAFYVVGPPIEKSLGSMSTALPRAAAVGQVLAGAIFLLNIWTGRKLLHRLEPSRLQFNVIDQEVVDRFGSTLARQRVAMGDRAGEFAAAYPGPVMQLEGLMSDVQWFNAVRARSDLRTILCRRGIKFVLSYQADLGNYSKVSFPVLRPALTQYKGPYLGFDRETEVGHLSNLDVADLRTVPREQPYNVLYIWRLPCQKFSTP